jgi:magnesium chelatase subunit D
MNGSKNWELAQLAAAVFAINPHRLGGVDVKAFPGPVRDTWIAECSALLNDTRARKVPVNVSEARLLGGLNFMATAKAGKPVMEQGLLSECHNQVLLMPMAERAERRVIAHISQALDSGTLHIQRDGFAATLPAAFGVLALNEGIDDEALNESLSERLAFQINLYDLAVSELSHTPFSPADIVAARHRLHTVSLSDTLLTQLVTAAAALGVQSSRATLFALETVRALAALNGRKQVTDDDVGDAIALTLGHRATQLPAPPQNNDTEPAPTPDMSDDNRDHTEQGEAQDQRQQTDRPPAEQLLEAAQAAIPADLLRKLSSQHNGRKNNRSVGKSGAEQLCLKRGRPCGTIAGDPRRGGKLQLIATLRAAAPWQALRNRERTDNDQRAPIDIRKQDLRLTRYRHRSESTTVFVVDASGSAAMHRLAEVKGAVELLLADCYSRRDSVALISFRGDKAELLLSPTRSLVRAKRALAGLPGGGGTPLAHAIDTATLLAEQIQRAGGTPNIVLLTDGIANIDRIGVPGRAKAREDALASARKFRARSINSILIDTSPRGQTQAHQLAQELASQYLPLPHANAHTLFDAVRVSL